MSMILLIICICICINTYTTYKISLAGFNSTPPMEESTYCQCWIAGLKLTTVFAFTISSSSWFQCITLLMNNEFLYCSVLLSIAQYCSVLLSIAQYCSVLHIDVTVVSSALELFLTELFTILALSKLSKRFGLMLRFGLLFTKNS